MGSYDEYLTRVQWGPSNKFQQWVVNRIIKHIIVKSKVNPTETSVLEIGVGTGKAIVALQKLGFKKITGVEPTTALAEYSRETHRVEISKDSLPNLVSYSDNCFQLVFSIHVLEHAPDWQSARDWVQEMIRVATPGGVIAIVTPDYRDYGKYFYDSDWSHGYPTTPNRIVQILTDLKLSIEFSGNMYLGNLGFSSMVAAKLINLFIPTRIIDAFSRKIIGRPLASGLKIATLWGLTFVIAQKPND